MRLGQVGVLAGAALCGVAAVYVIAGALMPPPRQASTVVAKTSAPEKSVSKIPAPSPDEGEPEPEAPDPVIVSPGPATRPPGTAKGVVILQIGDSHTAADFMTGELRRQLQTRFGKGPPGYVTAGRPHAGVRNAAVTVTASKGWSYKSLQRPDSRAAEFWLAGYSSIATDAGETLTFTADRTTNFEMIEIEAIAHPEGGKIEIRLDGRTEGSYDLKASRSEPVVIRMMPDPGPTERMRELSIVTSGAGTVNIASIAIYNRRAGVTYNSVGYVGATAGFVNRFDRKLFANALERIDPHIVVLAFGTNEATNEGLDIAAYARSYERAVDRIKTALPKAVIVVVSPPDFNMLSPECRKEKKELSCLGGPALASSDSKEGEGSPECGWRTPAKLAQIRDVQQEIAQRHGLVYWSWASIMPRECGAHQWFRSSPQLMAKDHMHFTINGYKKSAEEFLNVLVPVVEKVRAAVNAASND